MADDLVVEVVRDFDEDEGAHPSSPDDKVVDASPGQSARVFPMAMAPVEDGSGHQATEGGYALAEIIKDWHGIRHLDLRDNDLDDGAATALLKACGDESAPHCVLDLEGNEGISDEIFRRVDMARGVEAFFRS